MQDKIFLNSHYAFRADTLENWQRENPILENGEPSIVSDGTENEWLKIGDGVTAWNDLEYKQGPQGKKGADGKDGQDYILTESDIKEIAEGVKPEIDQTYSPESKKAQSGKAVAEALEGFKLADYEKITELTFDKDAYMGLMFDAPYKSIIVFSNSIGATQNDVQYFMINDDSGRSESALPVETIGTSVTNSRWFAKIDSLGTDIISCISAKAANGYALGTPKFSFNKRNYLTTTQYSPIRRLSFSQPFLTGTKIYVYGVKA